MNKTSISVNGINVPVITDMTRWDSKLKGIRKGSVIILSNSCRIPSIAETYLKSKDIIVVRIDIEN